MHINTLITYGDAISTFMKLCDKRNSNKKSKGIMLLLYTCIFLCLELQWLFYKYVLYYF